MVLDTRAGATAGCSLCALLLYRHRWLPPLSATGAMNVLRSLLHRGHSAIGELCQSNQAFRFPKYWDKPTMLVK